MSEINIWEILRDTNSTGEKFYSIAFGEVEIDEIRKDKCVDVMTKNGDIQTLSVYVHLLPYGEECILFPSRKLRDWEKFKEQYSNRAIWQRIDTAFGDYSLNLSCEQKDFGDNKLDRCVAALFKIINLIDISYEGNVTEIGKTKYYPSINYRGEITVSSGVNQPLPFGFKNSSLCHDFLSYPENVELIKDFYMYHA